MIKKAVLIFLFSTTAFGAKCSSAFKTISLKDLSVQPYYMRVHPSGNYILFSGEHAVILDITDRANPKEIKTYMNKETYPVETANDWKWVASPNHQGKMRYYDFHDLLKNSFGSKAVYEDAGLNDFYQSSAQLPGSTEKVMHFRTSVWTAIRYRDYTAYFDGGIVPKKVEATEVKSLCPNLKDAGFRQPILSKDGTEIAGNTKEKDKDETTKVFKIEKDKCVLDYDVGFNTSKVSFNYPKPGERAKITFTATIADPAPPGAVSRTMKSGVWIFDPNVNKTFPISPPDQTFSVFFPNFTQDGRLYYGLSKGSEFLLVIVDAQKMMSSACQ